MLSFVVPRSVSVLRVSEMMFIKDGTQELKILQKNDFTVVSDMVSRPFRQDAGAHGRQLDGRQGSGPWHTLATSCPAGTRTGDAVGPRTGNHEVVVDQDSL